ncbi:hypothetical protein SODALDRAFT_382343 [Sodiomyces alkalinus F11]|uniref:Uncharacterized protein n=1 Tax=Sodiomyces alkalinus (strain CBS 110278 / VKM F-3762 / F11) TaxID=1314773 RepID=A0A3N2PJS0_SODAK|nr:hypothetical protein SODALDRAFT_382343 [Sodiomyces alkalinus F11]ROT34771.1 hypothetical protein SODALDRAFT_382343 [Sodiomyces alkalinus F11]
MNRPSPCNQKEGKELLSKSTASRLSNGINGRHGDDVEKYRQTVKASGDCNPHPARRQRRADAKEPAQRRAPGGPRKSRNTLNESAESSGFTAGTHPLRSTVNLHIISSSRSSEFLTLPSSDRLATWGHLVPCLSLLNGLTARACRGDAATQSGPRRTFRPATNWDRRGVRDSRVFDYRLERFRKDAVPSGLSIMSALLVAQSTRNDTSKNDLYEIIYLATSRAIVSEDTRVPRMQTRSAARVPATPNYGPSNLTETRLFILERSWQYQYAHRILGWDNDEQMASILLLAILPDSRVD